jgi:hypothetical protein
MRVSARREWSLVEGQGRWSIETVVGELVAFVLVNQALGVALDLVL